MKLWLKMLIILAVAVITLAAYFQLKPETNPKNAEGTGSMTSAAPNELPSENTVNSPENPELDGFSGIDEEIDALSGSM